MAGIRIEFNEAGFRELLTSSGAKALVRGHAEEMAAKANAVPSTTEPAATEPYYEVEDASTDRARYRVRTTSARAAKHEAKTQALQKALGSSSTASVASAARKAPTRKAPSSTRSSGGKGRWTAEELGLLRTHSNEEIAAQTGRTVGAVVSQRYSLGRRRG